MIQRPQTIYLAIVTILMIFLLFIPIAELMLYGDDLAKFFSYGVVGMDTKNTGLLLSTIPISILIFIIIILSVVTIVFYKKRPRQLRLCVFNILLMIGLIIMIFFYYFTIKKDLGVIQHTFRFAIVIPPISIILAFQAFRGIRRDEFLVKSYERLR
ncbi:MAG: DUF4293 domain-containing protein [Bacteroidales bacterium]|nr:DUF4293 domain-containing protein [Bacteroidales bacterium]